MDATETFISLHFTSVVPKTFQGELGHVSPQRHLVLISLLQLDLTGFYLTRQKAEDSGLPGKLVDQDQSGKPCPLPKQPVFMGKSSHSVMCPFRPGSPCVHKETWVSWFNMPAGILLHHHAPPHLLAHICDEHLILFFFFNLFIGCSGS